MEIDFEVATLLEAIPNDVSLTFRLADLLMKRGDIRGEILRLSYDLVLREQAEPERTENERKLQRLLSVAYLPLVPSHTNCLGMRFSFIPYIDISISRSAQKHLDSSRYRPFFMSVTPVTQAQWSHVMKFNPSYFEGDDKPVEGVTWDDCLEYCNRLTEITGQPVRLPTSSEWEFACRAGTMSEYYSGNGEVALARVGWYEGNSDDGTHPVGKKIPNAWGLYDMHGNVYEWTDSVCWLPDEPKCRVLRGGAWGRPAHDCTASSTWCYPEDVSNFSIGFRVCFTFSKG
jgi:formylglycine-generating enzyme required for sulfatase activity